MPIPTIPPDYGFAFVLEHLNLDPSIPFRVAGYSEPQRETRSIRLLGKQRPLVFVRDRATRDNLYKRGWKDRTEAFVAEWKQTGDGGWSHQDVLPPIVPIREPDPRQQPAPSPGNGGLDAAIEVLDALTVKQAPGSLASGSFDPYLTDLLRREQSREGGRAGVVVALANRIGTIRGAGAVAS